MSNPLRRALQLDPNLDEAMVYSNLLYRLRAHLSESPEEYTANIKTADEFVQRALTTKQRKSGGMIRRRHRRPQV